ncbi:glycoside hydrolase family 108 protein [Glycocaulis sp.]
MASRFAKALDHVLKWEGGYVDHPDDPGGATNFGITLATLQGWRGRSVTKADVKALTKAEAGEIYKARYWDQCRCDELPEGVDAIVFDAAVNHGPGRAARLLQEALNVGVDGIIGPITMGAAKGADPRELVCEIGARRMVLYGSLAHFRTFGLGWSRRLMGTVVGAVG